MQEYAGSVALVSGGGSGIGAATARALSQRGASVLVADVDPDAARRVADSIGGEAVDLDVRDPAAWAAVAAGAEVDLALLAAGVVGPREVVGADADEIARVVEVDLLGVLHGTVALAGAMAQQGRGRIVAVSSAAGLFPMPLAPAYGAAKWGVVGWVMSAAPGLAQDGVTLCALCPAWTDTPFLGDDDRALLTSVGARLLDVEDVVTQALRLLAEGQPGEIVHVDADHGPARAVVQPRFTRLGDTTG